MSGDDKIGYSLKALGSAIWALRYCNSIEEGLIKVIREGGDSDINGAVVGSLLSAKFGFREITPCIQLIGFEIIPSPYFNQSDIYLKFWKFKLPITYDKKVSLRNSKVYFIFELKIIVKNMILYSIYKKIR